MSQYSDRLFPVVEDAVARDGGSASMQDLIRCAAQREERVIPAADCDQRHQGGGGRADERQRAPRHQPLPGAAPRSPSRLRVQQAHPNARAVIRPQDCKGLVMVDVTDERIDPATVIAAILRDVVDSGCSRSRHLIRMMPLQATCFASLEDLEVTAKPLIEKHFGSAADSNESAKRKVCADLACPCALLSCRTIGSTIPIVPILVMTSSVAIVDARVGCRSTRS